jgi:hypothetical protein
VHTCLQLRFRQAGEPVAGSNGKRAKFQIVICHVFFQHTICRGVRIVPTQIPQETDGLYG